MLSTQPSASTGEGTFLLMHVHDGYGLNGAETGSQWCACCAPHCPHFTHTFWGTCPTESSALSGLISIPGVCLFMELAPLFKVTWAALPTGDVGQSSCSSYNLKPSRRI
eukprot:591228-Pelagomonas_calceolata.AAC.3